MPNSQFSNPRILESPLVAGEITQKLEASHVPAVARCHGCHGLPRVVPRPESDKTLDFIGLPRVPRPFSPLGVGAPFRWSKTATSRKTKPETPKPGIKPNQTKSNQNRGWCLHSVSLVSRSHAVAYGWASHACLGSISSACPKPLFRPISTHFRRFPAFSGTLGVPT